jgi:hypothetical protein
MRRVRLLTESAALSVSTPAKAAPFTLRLPDMGRDPVDTCACDSSCGAGAPLTNIIIRHNV